MKVLCVDDSMIMRKIIRECVDLLGYDFLEAGDGQQALEMVEKEFDGLELILLDWNMPVMNGYDALVALKADDRFKHIPIMMVTTEAERENVVKAIQAGAKHYVTKPFSQEDLTTKILEALGLG